MKLAEALILRADTQRRYDQVKQRLIRNARTQEGLQPAEEPATLLAESERLGEQLLALIQNINRTNSATEIEPGLTISAAISRRDVLRLRHQLHRDLAQAANVTYDARTRSEVRFIGTVDVPAIHRLADDLAQQHRELDARIQAANWATELME